MNIGIIGNGFVGGALREGFVGTHKTFCFDCDRQKSPNTLNEVMVNGDIIFLCVPTPPASSGKVDLSYVRKAIKDASSIDNSKLFVIKSTVPPGTCGKFSDEFGVKILSNPEFLTERFALSDFLNPRAVIIGSRDKADAEKLVNVYRELYAPLEQAEVGGIDLVKYKVTSLETAEMIKYATNCFFSVKIGVMNEFFEICNSMGVDFNEMISGVLADGRVFPEHVSVPGPDAKMGFGGKCLPKDLNGLVFLAKEKGLSPIILESTITKNKLLRQEDA